MWGKWHFLKAIHYIRFKKCVHRHQMWNGFGRKMRNKMIQRKGHYTLISWLTRDNWSSLSTTIMFDFHTMVSVLSIMQQFMVSRWCFGSISINLPPIIKYFCINHPLQSLWTRKWNLIYGFHNIGVIIICIILWNVHNIRLEIKMYTILVRNPTIKN
jgi:hypothetical protein